MSDGCLLYCDYRATCIFADPLQTSHACHRFWTCHKALMFCSLLARCRIHSAWHAKSHPNWLPKVVGDCQPLTLFTCECASRQNGLYCFYISTSKNGPAVRCWGVFHILILTSKRALRHSRVHFLNIGSSKSAPRLLCFTISTLKSAARHCRVRFFNISTAKAAPDVMCF